MKLTEDEFFNKIKSCNDLVRCSEIRCEECLPSIEEKCMGSRLKPLSERKYNELEPMNYLIEEFEKQYYIKKNLERW